MSEEIIPFPLPHRPYHLLAEDAHRSVLSVQEDGLPDAETPDVILVVWRDGGGLYHLTRFVWGHEDGSYRFDTRQEAIDAADMCRNLCRVAILDETGEAAKAEAP